MSAPQGLDARLQRLVVVARDLPAKSALDEFKKALASANHHVVARAAILAAKAKACDLVPALTEAMTRLIALPAASDKGCTAKLAIVRALHALDCQDYGPYLLGARHVQMEPAWGEPVDTAVDLRGDCAIILARRHYPDIYFLTLDLLFDKEDKVRAAAASVLGGVPSEASELLLRMKLKLPEESADVLQKCFSSLLAINPDRSWDFVADFLSAPNAEMAERAALAIGDSHNDRAFPALRAAADKMLGEDLRRTVLLAMVLTRSDEAIDYLLDQVRTDSAGKAIQALEALSVNAADTRLRERAWEAADSRHNRQIDDAFHRYFG